MQDKSYSKKSYSDNTLEEESINLLEWDSLKTHLSSFASTEMGKRSILSFVIPSEYEASKRLLNETVEINELEKNLDKPWDWIGISLNLFNYEKELFIEKRMKEYLASYRIQQYYWKGICNPHCQIGYNKVNRDYDKLFTEDGRVKRIKLN